MPGRSCICPSDSYKALNLPGARMLHMSTPSHVLVVAAFRMLQIGRQRACNQLPSSIFSSQSCQKHEMESEQDIARGHVSWWD